MSAACASLTGQLSLILITTAADAKIDAGNQGGGQAVHCRISKGTVFVKLMEHAYQFDVG